MTQTIAPTLLNAQAPDIASFQSHNQLGVANSRGWFFAIRDTEDAPAHGPWKLYWRKPDGTLSVLMTSVADFQNAPAVERDETDDIYVFNSVWGANRRLTVYKFISSENYSVAHLIHNRTDYGTSKFSVLYRRANASFNYTGLGDGFLCLNKAGAEIGAINPFTVPGVSNLQYPLFAIDGAKMIVAWTTTPSPPLPNNSSLRYTGIHVLWNDAAQFRSPVTGAPVTSWPVVADADSPSMQIVPAPYKGQVDSWLADVALQDDVAHFIYDVGAWPNNHPIYQRYRLNANGTMTLIDLRDGFQVGGVTPSFVVGGRIIQERDGSNKLYIVAPIAGGTNHRTKLWIARSLDNGDTWSEYARSSEDYFVYGPSAPRFMDGQGLNIAFTDLLSYAPDHPLNAQKTYFAHLDELPPQVLEINSGEMWQVPENFNVANHTTEVLNGGATLKFTWQP